MRLTTCFVGLLRFGRQPLSRISTNTWPYSFINGCCKQFDVFGSRVELLGSDVASLQSGAMVPFLLPKPKVRATPLPGLSEQIFREAAMRTAVSSLPKLPWERGYASMVLGNSALNRWPIVAPPFAAAVMSSQLANSSAEQPPVDSLPTNVSATAARRVRFCVMLSLQTHYDDEQF